MTIQLRLLFADWCLVLAATLSAGSSGGSCEPCGGKANQVHQHCAAGDHFCEGRRRRPGATRARGSIDGKICGASCLFWRHHLRAVAQPSQWSSDKTRHIGQNRTMSTFVREVLGGRSLGQNQTDKTHSLEWGLFCPMSESDLDTFSRKGRARHRHSLDARCLAQCRNRPTRQYASRTTQLRSGHARV
jgi:hypothetical protein